MAFANPPDAEIGALLDGKTPDPPISDDRMCAAGKIYLAFKSGADNCPLASTCGMVIIG